MFLADTISPSDSRREIWNNQVHYPCKTNVEDLADMGICYIYVSLLDISTRFMLYAL